MLQQTQVAAVIPYFERFMHRFPSVDVLARAPLDAVLAQWAGLGYYARARNLHAAARQLVAEFAGELPRTRSALERLPGIGRSTAGAILALAHGRREAILDGNVKRVLARYHGIEGWTGESSVAQQLWCRAEQHTPRTEVAAYTQAIMDLGATLCTRPRPHCENCPVRRGCVAARLGRQAELPAPRPRRVRPRRKVRVLLVKDHAERILLERRPNAGIWGGLFSLPELGVHEEPAMWCSDRLNARASAPRTLPAIEHAFTHFDLTIEPLLLELETNPAAVMDRPDWLWYKPASDSQIGLAAPIAALLRSIPALQELRP